MTYTWQNRKCKQLRDSSTLLQDCVGEEVMAAAATATPALSVPSPPHIARRTEGGRGHTETVLRRQSTHTNLTWCSQRERERERGRSTEQLIIAVIHNCNSNWKEPHRVLRVWATRAKQWMDVSEWMCQQQPTHHRRPDVACPAAAMKGNSTTTHSQSHTGTNRRRNVLLFYFNFLLSFVTISSDTNLRKLNKNTHLLL